MGGFLIFPDLSNSGSPPAEPEVYPGLLASGCMGSGTLNPIDVQGFLPLSFDTLFNSSSQALRLANDAPFHIPEIRTQL